jgi:hypothetical protein
VNKQLSILQERYPTAHLGAYFAFVESCRGTKQESGRTNEHHICPKKQFPEYEHDPDNLITLTIGDHAHAHKLLAAAVPELCNLSPWISAGHSQTTYAKMAAASSRPEVKACRSAAQKRRYANPEERERRSEAQAKYWEDPEARERLSAKMKRTPDAPKRLGGWQ